MRSLLTDLLLQGLEQQQEGTLNKRLYDTIRLAILSGDIAPGRRLPSSRDLAQQLSLSRNTVIAAFEQLLAEGYIETRTGSGSYVTEQLPDTHPPDVRDDTLSPLRPAVQEISRRGMHLLGYAGASARQWGAFMPGIPDIASFPHDLWRRLQTRLSRRLKPEQLSYSPIGGCPELQQALVDYLRVARSVTCTPEQILITEGTHQAMDLLAKMLCNPGDLAWIEDPCYWGMRNVLTINGLRVAPIEVDEQGMVPPEDVSPQSVPRLICVTPSHQYPLGAVMSLARRQRLLALAQEHSSWVIEDDYDSEFRFSGSPIPALQGLQTQPPVIYIGTCSKTLYPGLRVSYMVLPPHLARELKTAHAELYRGGHLLTQLTLSQFIREGHYAAHIRRMRLLYARRRALLSELIVQHLGEDYLGYNSNAGLHLILRLPDHIDDVVLSARILQHGVMVKPLSSYYLRPTHQRGLLLGYASVDDAEMVPAFEVILRCLGALENARA
ncbi:PLP-dependent aminotransferase family protein [Dickeya dadantii]|uniref:Putative GntR-family regulatory protein and aminotransferase near polyamine transporter n=1 Tax=Dickeya dadantii (strain 3937) TaxID=198628 RepID=E0SE97_DICD3|nr:PLP-dependent aminotransferase family protein [Dickeya dadantii]ADM98720.1 Putative GntR-family regulatory protein and aminotransferase near polyamine transporter [Dickeya dadantii 3937]MCL6406616.1 PLP-dependent aminotransferase family protein [Dickeya dadantii]NAT79388.1 PLP-dependent aminotransferase family protein [Dickeya dadantii]NPE63027.1 PLP-dependent aminotransferase family protein [Dickeya dadantii]